MPSPVSSIVLDSSSSLSLAVEGLTWQAITVAHVPASCGGLPAQQAIVQGCESDDDDTDALKGARPESSASASINAATMRGAGDFKALRRGNCTKIFLSEKT